MGVFLVIGLGLLLVVCSSGQIVIPVNIGFPINGGWFPVGSSGGVVSRPSTGRLLADGTVVHDCFDWSTGQHADGEVWIRQNAWKVKCNNGTTSVIACIGTRRTNFAEIAIDGNLVVNGFWHKCTKDGDDIRYTQEPSCVIGGKELHINETFRNGAFKMKCETWGHSIVGCYYYDGSSVGPQELAVGQTADVGVLRHKCESVPNFPGRVKYSFEATACQRKDKVYQVNETWVEGNLKMKCLDSGAYVSIGCVLKDGRELKIGEDLVENNTVHRCYRLGMTTYYHSYSCGVMGVSCTPKPMPSASGNFGNSVVLTGGTSDGAVVMPTGGVVVPLSGGMSSGGTTSVRLQPSSGSSAFYTQVVTSGFRQEASRCTQQNTK